MKVVTSWATLMQYAKELGDARRTGDAGKIATAKKKHDDYRDVCLSADEMCLHMTRGQLGA
jgi:hypothetical protein